MFKTIIILLVISAYYVRGSIYPENSSNNRQKKLLFYDEEGNLVKTYTNPYLRDFFQNDEKMPFIGNFFNPFFSLFRPSLISESPTTYMIPVSDEVIQQVNNDPLMQNKLFVIPSKELSVEENSLCNGIRGQIPSSKSCKQFLNCWDGWAFQQECPNGLFFSSKGYCDYFHNVDCGMRKVNEPQETQTQCRKDFETFRNERNCNEFFICVNRMPVKFKCPANLAFSMSRGVCDFSENVHCEMMTSYQPTTASAPTMATEVSPNSGHPVKPSSDMRTVLMKDIFNTKSWTSTHVAISRQDAIRQLGRINDSNSSKQNTS